MIEKTYYISKQQDCLYLTTSDGEQVSATDLLRFAANKRVFAFDGQMGAGKTTFIKQLCEQMGVVDVVNSPTFAIVNVYQTKENSTIYHFDCYRLKSLQEAVDLGAEEYLYSGDYCFIEWPDIIDKLLPEDTVYVKIEVLEDNRRKCTVMA